MGWFYNTLNFTILDVKHAVVINVGGKLIQHVDMKSGLSFEIDEENEKINIHRQPDDGNKVKYIKYKKAINLVRNFQTG